jgi:hypothetical protein
METTYDILEKPAASAFRVFILYLEANLKVEATSDAV